MQKKLAISFFLCLFSMPLRAIKECDEAIDEIEQKIINNIIEYQRSIAPEGSEQLTRSCLFQTQITQFNIPFVISTPGYYCVTPQTILSALQTGQNATSSSINSQSLNQTNPVNVVGQNVFLPITTTGQNTFQVAQPSLQTINYSTVNGHLITNYQNLTNQQQQVLAQQQISGLNLTVNDFQKVAITVNSNDVIIDLNGNEIIGIGSVNTSGINVNGFVNVSIRNGTIRNMINNGITILNNNTTAQSNRNIIIRNITFYNNTLGLSMTGGVDAIISANDAYFNNGTGFVLNNNTNAIIDNCTSSNNLGGGFVTTSNIGMQFINCTANNNGAGGFANTFLIESEFQNCTSNENNLNGFSVIPGTSQSTNVNFSNSVAHDNTLSGFLINGNAITLEDCKANLNTNGFQIFSTNNVLLNCIAQGNISNGILLSAAAAGNPVSSNSQVRSNTVTNNGNGINNQGTTNHIYSNFASNNTNDYVNVPNVAISPVPAAPINFTTNIAE